MTRSRTDAKHFEVVIFVENNRIRGLAEETEEKETTLLTEELNKALENMKNEKAVGPDDMLARVWKCVGEHTIELVAD